MDKNFQELSEKYQKKLENQFDSNAFYYHGGKRIGSEDDSLGVQTREYEQFKEENMPTQLSLYEKLCNESEKILKVAPSAQKAKLLQDAIDKCHLNITPTGASSFAILIPLLTILILGMSSYLLLKSSFVSGFFVFAGLIMMPWLGNLPIFIAANWRMKASQQMVISVFYVVTYMRHTSNLENAIQFASDHLSPPLSIDFRRIIWNVETLKHSTVKESLDEYLEQWRETNMEFVEAFHLIESSLYEGSDERRLDMIDKSLDVILEGTYEKMLHFAQGLKSPVNTLNMLGVILPILGLVILPLIVSFMADVSWYHIAILYNVGLPAMVYFYGKSILNSRPSGYGDTSIEEPSGDAKKVNVSGLEFNMDAKTAALSIFLICAMIGFSPLIMHVINPDLEISLYASVDDGFELLFTDDPQAPYHFLEYKVSDTNSNELIGPFGLGASLISLFVPLGLGLGFGTYYKMKSQNVIQIREASKKLELEFSSALFQLGNRLGDGLPAEMVFGKVSEVMQNTVSGNFFGIVNNNVRKMGMSIEDAVFNSKNGALKEYPSSLIESSMKVLIQSVRKGPEIAAQAMANVARYVKEIHKVNERLKDLMAEIVSSMNGQVRFLAPAISGIVVGITCMITSILGKLSTQMKEMESLSKGGGAGGLMGMFGQGLPTYYFQIIVGIYVVQLSYILTVIMNTIDNGEDKLGEHYLLGQNMTKSITLYTIIAFIVMFLFNIIASAILVTTNAVS